MLCSLIKIAAAHNGGIEADTGGSIFFYICTCTGWQLIPVNIGAFFSCYIFLCIQVVVNGYNALPPTAPPFWWGMHSVTTKYCTVVGLMQAYKISTQPDNPLVRLDRVINETRIPLKTDKTRISVIGTLIIITDGDDK